MLFHQRLGLLLDRGGAYRLVTFNPHRGLDSLGDFFVQVGTDLHHSSPKVTRLVRVHGEAWRVFLAIIISSVSAMAGTLLLGYHRKRSTSSAAR